MGGRRPPRADLALGAGLAAYACVEALSGSAPGVGAAPGDAATSAAAGGVAAGLVALWTTAPLTGLAGSVGALVAEAALTRPLEGLAPLVAQLLLVAAVAARCRRRPAVAALVLAVAALGVAVGDPVFLAVLYGSAWLAGRVLGDRQRQVERLRSDALDVERAAEEAVAAERRRLAHELHDVVSHALSLVVVQAQLAEATVRSDPDAAERALTVVRDAGRHALQDMRRLLDVLDDGTAGREPPQPALADVDGLVDVVRRAGVEVEVVRSGDPRPLPAGASLTAYRVVQEGLTNALRHAAGARVRVELAWTPDALTVTVADDGAGRAVGSGSGRGLIGLRERVDVFGGRLDAGQQPSGGYAVTAVLPG